MTAPVYKRSLLFRGMNSLGVGLEKCGIRYPSLSEEDLLRDARKSTGLDDFGSESFLEPMRQLLSSLENEAQLNMIGRFMTRETFDGYLQNRLRIHEEHQQRPEIATSEIRKPLIIAGLPRTGTTLLFNLLSMDPGNRAPMGWELEKPFPVPEPANQFNHPQIAVTQKRFDTLYKISPPMASIHMFGAMLPQECVATLAHEFMSVQFPVMYNIPSYQAWLDRWSYLPALQFHRSYLQFLQSRQPTHRWLLKTPGYLSILDEVFEVYPDVQVIHTHRDPMKVMPSQASLAYHLRLLGSDAVDPFLCGKNQLELWTRNLDRAMGAREKLSHKKDQFFDVQFEEVLKDPIAVIGKIYSHFGIEFTSEARERMEQCLRDNPREKHGSHKYTLEDFGLDAARDSKCFEQYCDLFEIPASNA